MRITVQGVSVRYASHPALVEAELSVKEGEILTLVGPNGAGKSTLLRTIAGTLRPQAGVVYLDLRNVQEIPAKQRAKILAMVEQGAAPSFDFTVQELVELGRIPHVRRFARLGKGDEEAVEKALRLCG
ncbi:MAG: ABC transporter ATP-binding protein, partial [Candidatus Bipolaricaulaceae bacterium]